MSARVTAICVCVSHLIWNGKREFFWGLSLASKKDAGVLRFIIIIIGLACIGFLHLHLLSVLVFFFFSFSMFLFFSSYSPHSLVSVFVFHFV